jgi:hypothetical protein
MNNKVVVVCKFVGFWVIEVVCMKSLTWSSAIITMTSPRVMSILLMRFIRLLVAWCLLVGIFVIVFSVVFFAFSVQLNVISEFNYLLQQ